MTPRLGLTYWSGKSKIWMKRVGLMKCEDKFGISLKFVNLDFGWVEFYDNQHDDSQIRTYLLEREIQDLHEKGWVDGMWWYICGYFRICKFQDFVLWNFIMKNQCHCQWDDSQIRTNILEREIQDLNWKGLGWWNVMIYLWIFWNL